MKIYGPQDFGFTVLDVPEGTNEFFNTKITHFVDFTALDENFSEDVAVDLEDILWDEEYLCFGENFCASAEGVTKDAIIKKLTELGFRHHGN